MTIRIRCPEVSITFRRPRRDAVSESCSGRRRQIGISIVAGRRAVLTRPHNGHAACHYCGACGRGCDVAAFFNSTDYLLEPAFKTGKLTIVDNAVAAHILVDDKGAANGVQYFDRYTKEEHKVYAKRVVVAASCIDSTRLLLNSKSSAYPERDRQFE